MGREPVERHEHYGADGVLTGYTVVRRDPEFTREDVAWLLARRRKKAEADSRSYGIPLAEAMDPKNQFAFKGPKAPVVDYAEKAYLDALEAYYKRNPDASKHGHRWGGVTRRE